VTANPQAKRGKKDQPAGGSASSAPGAAAPVVQPLKPRPRLLAVMSVLFAAWVVFLVTLYFRTTHPRRSTIPGYDAQGRVEPASPDAATRPSP
jgi:hypothetical protein